MPTATAIRLPGHGAWSTLWRYGLAILWWLFMLVLYIAVRVVGASTVPIGIAVLDLALGGLTIGGVRFRHRWPRTVVVASMLLSALSASGFVAALWAYAHLATRRRWREMVGFGALSVAFGVLISRSNITGLVTAEAPATSQLLVGVAGSVVIIALVAAMGSYVGARRDLLLAMRDRAEEAERRQETLVLQGQAEERNRIAREMHDVLAHRISLVSMHAGILAYRDDLPPDQVREIAGVIQDNARQSMSELRTILGSLRQDSDPAHGQPEAPQPGFDQIAALISDARQAGQRLEVREEIEHAELMPTLVGRHIYRVVQELITNARKHAESSLVRVELSGAPGEGVHISSRNPPQRGAAALPGAGMGLVGLRERANVLGGTMTSGVNEEGQFEVKVWFPW